MAWVSHFEQAIHARVFSFILLLTSVLQAPSLMTTETHIQKCTLEKLIYICIYIHTYFCYLETLRPGSLLLLKTYARHHLHEISAQINSIK